MKTETVSVAELKADPRNARKHGKRNLAAIKASLQRFGQQKPIVVGSDNVVIAGNGTLIAAFELGWSKIEIVRSELDGAKRKAFALADNRSAELAHWDKDVLGELINEIRSAEDLLFDAVGFTDKDLDRIYETGEDGEGGRSEPRVITCPNCSHCWEG